MAIKKLPFVPFQNAHEVIVWLPVKTTPTTRNAPNVFDRREYHDIQAKRNLPLPLQYDPPNQFSYSALEPRSSQDSCQCD